MVNIWQASVPKRLKQSTLNFPHTFVTGYSTKTCQQWVIHFFITLTWRVLIIFFSWKYFKAHYSKNIRKEEIVVRFCLSLGWLYISTNKLLKNCNSVGAGAQKVGKIVSLWPNFTLYFMDIQSVWKR